MADYNTPYYRIERTPVRKDAGKTWRVRATIHRQDSGEVIDQILIREGESVEEVEKRLDEALRQNLGHLGKPVDWGKSPVPAALLDRYLAMLNKTYEYHLKSEDAPGSEVQKIQNEGRAYKARQLAALKKDVAALSNEQKVALVEPTIYQRANPRDPYVLDILAAKDQMFSLIENPTPEVQAAYQTLTTLMEQG